ncbi:MAG: ATP-binding protein [Planctomycetota bacterium]
MEHREIPSTWEAARQAGQEVLREVARLGYEEPCAFSIRLALEEGLINAVKHGNRMAVDKVVCVDYEVTAEQVEIIITDQGKGFDPSGIPDPTRDENIEKPCGRGLMLMKAFMDEIEFTKGGRRVRMVKRRGTPCCK